MRNDFCTNDIIQKKKPIGIVRPTVCNNSFGSRNKSTTSLQPISSDSISTDTLSIRIPQSIERTQHTTAQFRITRRTNETETIYNFLPTTFEQRRFINLIKSNSFPLGPLDHLKLILSKPIILAIETNSKFKKNVCKMFEHYLLVFCISVNPVDNIAHNIPQINVIDHLSFHVIKRNSPNYFHNHPTEVTTTDSTDSTPCNKIILNYNKIMQECSPYYFENMTANESKSLLKNKNKQSFVLRKSSKSKNFIFCLSLKTERGVTSVRIADVSGVTSSNDNDDDFIICDKPSMIPLKTTEYRVDGNFWKYKHSYSYYTDDTGTQYFRPNLGKLPNCKYCDVAMSHAFGKVTFSDDSLQKVRLDCSDSELNHMVVFKSIFHLIRDFQSTSEVQYQQQQAQQSEPQHQHHGFIKRLQLHYLKKNNKHVRLHEQHLRIPSTLFRCIPNNEERIQDADDPTRSTSNDDDDDNTIDLSYLGINNNNNNTDVNKHSSSNNTSNNNNLTTTADQAETRQKFKVVLECQNRRETDLRLKRPIIRRVLPLKRLCMGAFVLREDAMLVIQSFFNLL